ncbi:16S rRNA m(4) methyltransferase [Clostridium acetireducens DSM 10703]|jgi:hypothetical protein|uniref:16S rRNA m(4) methyltransferase n=1 Tax=Clostridium acetireducens DSM 10703 TaxID=1121290 RepID=A0A1E8F313_9CLOT|nr:class I SAM-dependent methyltransferase [Clostridium acetireducens]OFI07773.1 16S rRNA m(4) methyltransferase [Clostridium acetireducens DSM 10703]
MFNYVKDVSSISHYIISKFCLNTEIAIDATLGNGYDTDFLSSIFKKVYSFDIQKEAIDKYACKNKKNVLLIQDSHEELNKYIKEKVNCVIYNLGFLPGGNKEITTKYNSTITSIKSALTLLDSGGFISIAIYTGHTEGKQEEYYIKSLVKNLPKNKFAVLLHTFINRDNNPPSLIIIEKK